MKTISARLVLILALAPASILGAGCKTDSGGNRAAPATASLADLRKVATSMGTQIDTAGSSMKEMATTLTDPRPAFERYAKSVDELASLSVQSEKVTADVNKNSAAYFQQWETEANTIADADMKEHALERRKDQLEQFDKVSASMKDSMKGFKPYLAKLQDLKKILANDLTPAGLKAVHGLMEDMAKDGKDVREGITAVVTQIDKTTKALELAPPAAPPPK